MDKKLFKKTYKYICRSCGNFTHSFTEYCEICGSKDALSGAVRADYS